MLTFETFDGIFFVIAVLGITTTDPCRNVNYIMFHLYPFCCGDQIIALRQPVATNKNKKRSAGPPTPATTLQGKKSKKRKPAAEGKTPRA
jgi:hypothetical protein